MRGLIFNSKGYTLLEILLVLFVVTIISSIALQFTNKFSEKHLVDMFIQQVQLDIQTIQAHSIEHETVITLEFNSQNSYYAYYDRGGRIFERTYPPGIEITPYSTVRKIRMFKGVNYDFGKLRFKTPLGEKQIILNINKGRMKIV
ncbi:prepilin-type N-terminal cleavage/methylation domain-containing protein [Ureibacillus xyleni]|uniref:Prepilin-type N-terminal cleavage/methylation domain-containing protein n=1 Tax=Ureibacillus xyleni TaxID=614648 RepID=A0A285TV21_9BACL|nr:prepilin-type N-terminal cleavage/methylation domain-containing protein [Ureibacillus xyleni]SOC27372.1 prepilin-type N-terminal cleavage/methylation domain-containing protein [Ureibacillus xyleni]